MKLIYAHYSSLQNAFAQFLRTAQKTPQERVLVLCPSRRLSAHLQRMLARELGAVGNVFFKSFSGLLSELDVEDGTSKLPLLPGDNLHNFIIKTILQKPGLDRYGASRGFITALRADLRDLADSLAEPEVLLEHVRTSSDPKIEQDGAHLTWLARVYQEYLKETASVRGYRSYQQFFNDAADKIPSSNYLQSFSHIIFYGFYDLTGRQLELLNRVREFYSTTVFAPYVKHPAYLFAQKFFESNLLGNAEEAQEIPLDTRDLGLGEASQAVFTSSRSAPAKNLQVASAAGSEGELFFAAKEILKLTRDGGCQFSDIAIIARTLEPYKENIRRIFSANAIALRATLPFYLPSTPLGVFCLNLLGLLRNSFYREDILAVVTSAYFKPKNKWRYLIHESLASRDYSQWVDLIATKPENDDFLAWLETVKNKLEYLSGGGKWSVLAASAQQFLNDYVDEKALTGSDRSLYEQILKCVSGLSRYEMLRPEAKEGEFLEELADVLKQIEVNLVADPLNGVTVVDAINARGLSFKAVFILGLNEKYFPQVIKEDPILKDYYRRTLRDGLGFWINQKLERFDEEKLLFFNAVAAAKERLFVSYQRMNEEGKPAVVSSYLAELARAAQLDLQRDTRRVSARILERISGLEPGQLNQKEVSFLLAQGSRAEEKYKEAGLLTEDIRRALKAGQKLSSYGALNEFDGMIKSGGDVFTRSNRSGFSPSTLQDAAHCPMKYFFSKGLGLKEQEDAFSRFELAPNLRGEAYHAVLMDFYKSLYQSGLTADLFGSALEERLQQSVDKRYSKESYRQFGIYPVVWEIILEDIKAKLSAFVKEDAARLDGLIPSIFEELFDGIYQPSAEIKLKVKGYIDRIDIDPEKKILRVVDYKSSQKGGKELSSEILKHLILQPYLYWLLAEQSPRLRGITPQSAVLLNINKGYARQELTSEGFELVKPKADAFLALLAGFIQSGVFFLNLSDYCQYCPYGAICRKDSFKSLLRARHSRAYQDLEEARKA